MAFLHQQLVWLLMKAILVTALMLFPCIAWIKKRGRNPGHGSIASFSSTMMWPLASRGFYFRYSWYSPWGPGGAEGERYGGNRYLMPDLWPLSRKHFHSMERYNESFAFSGCPDLWGSHNWMVQYLRRWGRHSMSRKHELCLQRAQSVVDRHLWETWKFLILNLEEYTCTQKSALIALISRDLPIKPRFLDLVTGLRGWGRTAK